MPYNKRTNKEIPKWLGCPLCGNYETNQGTYFLKHFKQCEEYDGHIDDVESYNIDEVTTIGDFINQQMNCINLTNLLIQSNELETIQTHTPDEIRLFIKNKLLLTINRYTSIDSDAVRIQEFFFGETEQTQQKFIEEVMKII
jgi:hypothetical protein